jgi:hypothetical protein
LPIDACALFANLHSVTLVGKSAKVDCLRIAPHDISAMERRQVYMPDTNFVITRFLTVDGVGEIIDLIPIKEA